MGDKTYCYPPDYKVLKNKSGFKTKEQFNKFERLVSSGRALDCPDNFPITYDGYKQIHKHIFQDVYEWAGESRLVDISKGDLFCLWQYVDNEMEKRLAKIQGEKNLKGLSKAEFSEKAAEHISEINAIHPFREGNGRVQRLFLKNLAHQAGHDFQISRLDKDDWMEASVKGFREKDYEPMKKCIFSAINGDRNTNSIASKENKATPGKDRLQFSNAMRSKKGRGI